MKISSNTVNKNLEKTNCDATTKNRIKQDVQQQIFVFIKSYKTYIFLYFSIVNFKFELEPTFYP